MSVYEYKEPYDDKDMVYDEDLGQYVLTTTGVINGIFLDDNVLTSFQNMSNARLFLNEISEDIYRFVLDHKFVNERDVFKHLMNTNPNYRQSIKQALLYQVRYAFRSAGHALKDMHGVDIERSRLIKLNNLRGEVGISPSSVNKLTTAGLLSTSGERVYDIQVVNGKLY